MDLPPSPRASLLSQNKKPREGRRASESIRSTASTDCKQASKLSTGIGISALQIGFPATLLG